MANTRKLSGNALVVLRKRFLKSGLNGEPLETPEDLYRRVADNIALADAYYSASPREVVATSDKFYEAMSSLSFLSGTPLRNAGRRLQQLSACFVLPLLDSLDSIYEALKNSALIFRSGGAVGISFSKLRPRGSVIGSTGGKSSGPVSFMRLFDRSTNVINEGCVRFGGTMAVLRIDHPDILEFLQIKLDNEELNNFNLSVSVDDRFMELVIEGGDIELGLESQKKAGVQKIPARELYNRIAMSAWQSAEPGILFIDEINRHNPTPACGRIDAVNLCGEQPLLPYESCNLGSIVVSNFMTKDGKINYQSLREVVFIGVHFLENTIDVNHYVIPEVEKMTKSNRKIGLGIMGFADLLFKMGIPYNSEKASLIAEELMEFVTETAREASAKLAEKRGNFPNYSESIWAKNGTEYMRNATVTTIAPTGTTSLIADCTSGVEPIFALAYKRKHMKTLKGKELFYVHPEFKRIAKEQGFFSERLLEEISQKGRCQGVAGVPGDVQKVFVTAHDVAPEDHIRIQAAFQKHTDNAVSKTVNMPYKSTVDDIKNVYRLAYEMKCKGVTVYRDKSREKQVLNIGES